MAFLRIFVSGTVRMTNTCTERSTGRKNSPSCPTRARRTLFVTWHKKACRHQCRERQRQLTYRTRRSALASSCTNRCFTVCAGGHNGCGYYVRETVNKLRIGVESSLDPLTLWCIRILYISPYGLCISKPLASTLQDGWSEMCSFSAAPSTEQTVESEMELFVNFMILTITQLVIIKWMVKWGRSWGF